MKSFIILDRSGSMQSRWRETLGSLDAYVEGLSEDDKLWLHVFDNQQDTLLAGVKPSVNTVVRAMTNTGITPRGMTALYDAVALVAGIVATEGNKKVQIVILTDGLENASREANAGLCKTIIKGWKKKGYDVTMIGADFDAFEQAEAMGIGREHTIAYNTAKGDVGSVLRARATSYGVTGQSMDYTDEDRLKAEAGKGEK